MALLSLLLSWAFQTNAFNKLVIAENLKAINADLQKQQVEFDKIIADLKKDNELTLSDFTQFHDKPYTLQLFTNNQVQFWSSRNFVSQSILPRLRTGQTYILPFNGQYSLILKKELSSNKELVFSYPITNNKGVINTIAYPLKNFGLTTNEKNGIAQIEIDNLNKNLYISTLDDHTKPSRLTIFFWGLFAVLAYLGIWLFFINKSLKVSSYQRLLFFLLSTLLLTVFVRLDPLNVYDQFDLFQPTLYANKYIGESLGHFMINLFAMLFILFFWYKTPFVLKENYKLLPKWFTYGYSWAVICTFTVAYFYISRSAIMDSSEDLYLFSSLNRNTMTILVVLILSGFCHFFYINRLIKLLSDDHVFEEPLGVLITIGSLIILSIILFRIFDRHALFYIAWTILIITTLFYFYRDDNNITRISQSVFIQLLFALITTYSFITYTVEKDTNRIKHISRELSMETDYLAKYLLGIVNENISTDSVLMKQINNPFLPDDVVIKRIETLHLSNKFDDFQKKVELISDKTILNDFSAKESLIEQENSEYDMIHFEDYIPIYNNNRLYRLVKIELRKPKITDKQLIYNPLIDKNTQEFSFLNYRRLSYTIWQNGEIKNYKGTPLSFSPEDYASKPIGYFEKQARNDKDVFIFKENISQFVLISLQRTETANNLLITFAYTFTLILLTYLAFVLTISRLRPARLGFFRQSLSNRVQFMVLVILFSGALIIGAISNYQMVVEVNKFQRSSIFNQLDQIHDQFISQDKSENTYDFTTNFLMYLSNQYFNQPHDYHYYNASGELIFTNNDALFANNVWPTLIDPQPLNKFANSTETHFWVRDKVLNKNYVGFYTAIRDKEMDLMGIIFFPEFDYDLNNAVQINTFDNMLFSAFTLGLLVLTIFIIYFFRSFTNLLERTRHRISNVDIGKDTKYLEWGNTEDEIGILVKEYNAMLKKLDENALVLARTERESAWRDMAKQIAHEIKNPLTPMLLSIQHLKRKLDTEQSEQNEQINKTLNSLESQIHHLSKIANDFSSVAKTTLPEFAIFNLREVLQEINNIYQYSNRYNFYFTDQVTEQVCLVRADKTMINRVITNLLKNSLQSLTGENFGYIEIVFDQNEKDFIISVIDNGRGIPPENRAKIFTPNFTTKKSGTGIGLMMSKKIIDMHGGTINFESQKDTGTTFTVTLPKYK